MTCTVSLCGPLPSRNSGRIRVQKLGLHRIDRCTYLYTYTFIYTHKYTSMYMLVTYAMPLHIPLHPMACMHEDLYGRLTGLASLFLHLRSMRIQSRQPLGDLLGPWPFCFYGLGNIYIVETLIKTPINYKVHSQLQLAPIHISCIHPI